MNFSLYYFKKYNLKILKVIKKDTKMPDIIHEQIMSLPLQTTHQSTIVTRMPPFAPQPDYIRPTESICGTSAGRSTSTVVSSTDCDIHEVCYYFQKILFITAILTGIALVVAGSIMHAQNGELLVFVYIGVLLIAVNSLLLLTLHYVRKKKKHRSRMSRPIHYNPVSTTIPPSHVAASVDVSHNIIQQNNQQVYTDCHAVQSPTESQAKSQLTVHSSVHSHHHRQSRHRTNRSLPSTRNCQQHPSFPQFSAVRNERIQDVSDLPPSYDELIRYGHLPQNNTTVHLI